MGNTQAPLTPDVFMRESMLVLASLSATERIGLLEQARAWATVFYNGDVPNTTTQQLTEMEMQCRLLMTRADG
jgi:hypothetical protein